MSVQERACRWLIVEAWMEWALHWKRMLPIQREDALAYAHDLGLSTQEDTG
jgi:hypothetical protein